MAEYYSYIHRTLKFSWFSTNIKYKNNCINVGCGPHINQLMILSKNTKTPNIKWKMFNKWYKYPSKAHQLYWKLHPEEYPFK